MTQLSDYYFMMIGGLIGVIFHVMLKVRQLRIKFPDLSPGKVWGTFLFQEWDSLIVSGLVIMTMVFIVHLGGVKYLGIGEDWATLITFVGMIVIGYSGQRIAYKYLNTAEKVLSDKANTE